jgi:6-phosphofructokinase
MAIATEALDRLHTTASSHHRVIVCDIMGHNAGWLALGAGIAGGADVILIPEIPYDIQIVADSLNARRQRGKHFSIVAVAEGALSKEQAQLRAAESEEDASGKKKKKKDKNVVEHTKEPVSAILAERLEDLTGLETRITSLGYLQRGGIPTPTDRRLCSCYGATAARLALEGTFGVMVAKRGDQFVPVPLEEIVNKRRTVPLDHPWIHTARAVGTCLGDEAPHA